MSTLKQQAETTVQEIAVKLTPPVGVAGLQLAGIPLSEWVTILTLIYLVASMFFLFRDKWWNRRKGG